MIVVQGIPSGDIDGASPRLRYFSRKKYAPENVVWTEYEDKLDCDILFVQKRANKIDVITEAKRKGITVIYDSDDGSGIRRKGNDLPIFSLVDAITTDTEQRAQEFRKITDTPVYVIPDGIDYLEAPPQPMAIRDNIKQVCTFGSFRSTMAAVDYLLPLLDKYSVAYITDRKIKKLKKCNFKKWKFDSLVFEIQKRDVCVLAHENTCEKEWKGNARLLVAMAIGIPTIVSNTPSYKETMDACGLGDLVVSSPEEVSEKLDVLKNVHTRKFIQCQFMDYVWKNYRPERSALILANVFEGMLHAANTNI